jgi:LPXTG-motif cell wall-anchored protein
MRTLPALAIATMAVVLPVSPAFATGSSSSSAAPATSSSVVTSSIVAPSSSTVVSSPPSSSAETTTTTVAHATTTTALRPGTTTTKAPPVIIVVPPGTICEVPGHPEQPPIKCPATTTTTVDGSTITEAPPVDTTTDTQIVEDSVPIDTPPATVEITTEVTITRLPATGLSNSQLMVLVAAGFLLFGAALVLWCKRRIDSITFACMMVSAAGGVIAGLGSATARIVVMAALSLMLVVNTARLSRKIRRMQAARYAGRRG